MNVIFDVFFIIITAGVAFALRGIWGHQVGGWVMGVVMATCTSVVLRFDMATTVTLVFWSSVAWTLASFVGWANHGAVQRFARGAVAYGGLPGVVMALVLFPLSPSAWAVAALAVGIPTGAAFALSSWLIPSLQHGNRPGEQVSAWRYGVEYPAGLLHGAGILVFLGIATCIPGLSMITNQNTWSWYHVLYTAIAVCCVVPACAAKSVAHLRSQDGAAAREGSSGAATPGRIVTNTVFLATVVVAANITLVLTMIVAGSVIGLFATQLAGAGMAGILYEKHMAARQKLDTLVAWGGIIASIFLGFFA